MLVAATGHLWGPNPERGVYKTTDGGGQWDRMEGDIVIIPLITWFFGVYGAMPLDSDIGWIKLAIGKNGAGGSDFLVAKFGQEGERLYATGNGGAATGRGP